MICANPRGSCFRQCINSPCKGVVLVQHPSFAGGAIRDLDFATFVLIAAIYYENTINPSYPNNLSRDHILLSSKSGYGRDQSVS